MWLSIFSKTQHLDLGFTILSASRKKKRDTKGSKENGPYYNSHPRSTYSRYTLGYHRNKQNDDRRALQPAQIAPEQRRRYGERGASIDQRLRLRTCFVCIPDHPKQ